MRWACIGAATYFGIAAIGSGGAPIPVALTLLFAWWAGYLSRASEVSVPRETPKPPTGSG